MYLANNANNRNALKAQVSSVPDGLLLKIIGLQCFQITVLNSVVLG